MLRPVGRLSTTVLINRHEAHNLAIANKDNHSLDASYPIAVAKLVKLIVKLELIKRAAAGDSQARDYAAKCGWDRSFYCQPLAVAE